MAIYQLAMAIICILNAAATQTAFQPLCCMAAPALAVRKQPVDILIRAVITSYSLISVIVAAACRMRVILSLISLRNTLAHLLRDIEALRDFLHIKRWLVVGGSWGSTLALAYGQAHPERVLGFVLYMVVTTSEAEIEWITRGVGQFYPREHQRFVDHLPARERDGDLATAYHRLLSSPDKLIHEPAASAWCDWESSILATTPGYTPNPRWEDGRFRLCFARLVTHYWVNRAWLSEGKILNNISRISDIPAILIHGRLDFGSPLKTAFQLNQAWPDSRLIVVEDGGHDSSAPNMASRIVEAVHSIQLIQSEFG